MCLQRFLLQELRINVVSDFMAKIFSYLLPERPVTYLFGSIVLGFVHILLAGAFATKQRGTAWNVSARDGEPKPLTGVAARLDRALKNFLETYPLYLAAILVFSLQGKQPGMAETGSMVYLIARVIYLPLYAFGVPYVRTLSWLASIVGIVMIVLSVF